jgi:hypothetical protein
MPKAKEQILLSNGDLIASRLGLLVFLGIFLLGLGAGQALWTSTYRAFFVWLAFSLLAGGTRVAWKYSDYQRRERQLLDSIERQKELGRQREEETRKRQQQMNSLYDTTRRLKEEAVETEDEADLPPIPTSRHH